MIVFAILLTTTFLLGEGIVVYKVVDQTMRDKKRKVYRLAFPSDLDPERVTAWLRSLSGTLRPRGLLQATPSLVLEVWATNQGIEHRMKVPWTYEPMIRPNLESLIPGIRLIPENEHPVRVWVHAVEAGLRQSVRQLRIPNSSDLSTSILANFGTLNENETLAVQWVISPALPAHKPIFNETVTAEFSLRTLWRGTMASRDEVQDRREKLDEPNMQAVLRVAAVANTKVRAQFMVRGVMAALDSARGPATHFYKRLVPASELQARFDRAGSPMTFPVQLSAPELTAVIGWPIGNPLVAGLPAAVSRYLPAAESVPREGRVIGVSSFPGRERKIAVSYLEARKHVHVLGGTGCLHPDTPIYDPLDDITLTVKQRWELGKPFHVYAMHGTKLVVAPAAPPVEFQRVDMYRLYNAEHEILVTGQHRVWNGRDYVEVGKLYQQQPDAGVLLPSISDADLSRLRASGLSCWQIAEGSPVGRRPSHRLCGQLLQSASDSGPSFVPSLGDVGERSRFAFGRDGLPNSRARSRRGPRADRHSKSSSLNQANRDLASGVRAAPCTCEPPFLSRRAEPVSGSCSDHSDTSQLFAESPPQSSSCPCQSAPFNEYFQNNMFWVEAVGAETYFDFHVPILENYLACGLIHHNSGKTTLLANMFRQDVAAGYGVVLIESKGDLFKQALNYIPPERIDDVIVFDVNDEKMPVGFNILQQGNPATIVDELNMLFNALFRDHPSLWMQEVMYYGLRTLVLDKKATFIDLPALLSPEADEVDWRENLVRSVRDPQVKGFWQRFDNQGKTRQDQKIEPLMSRVWPMTRSKLMNIVGQSQSSFYMDDVVKQNKILLVNLSGIERGSATLMGTLLMNSLWNSVKTHHSEKGLFLYLDEFHHYMNLPVDLQEMLVEARSMGLGMVLAHQYLDQLTAPNMQEAIMSNARTKVAFQLAADDARAVANNFGKSVTTEDLLHLSKYEAMSRVSTGEGISSPLTLNTLPPMAGYGRSSQVLYASRGRYGKPTSEVQDEILKRRGAENNPRPARPRPNLEGWGNLGA